MALVRVPLTGRDEYALDVEVMPPTLQPHQKGRLRFHVLDLGTGGHVRRFELVHERIFHLFVISQDLAHFQHLHPVLVDDGLLEVDLLVPSAGVYHLIADFLPAGGTPQLIQRSFVTAGHKGPVQSLVKLATDVSDKVVNSTRIKLTMPDAVAGHEQLVTFDLQDYLSGVLVTNLEPYLGAAGHLLILSADGAIAMHSHPVPQLANRPSTVVFQVLFPRAGEYRMWAQFQRGGEVMTAPFTLPVRERD